MVREISRGVHHVGVQHWDRTTFDELIPLPHGTTYNSYLVVGNEKTALIDTVDPQKTHLLMENLEKLGVERIDYVVSNHAEQDHSGAIPAILKRYGSKVVTNERAKGMLMDLLPLEDDVFITVEDGEEMDLGGKTLRFTMTPWVHWPETMSTFLVEDGVLFSCDFFGAHLASSDVFSKDDGKVYEAAKRYYAEIMMPFRSVIRKNLQKVKDLNPKVIAPSHGPVYTNPSFIISAYEEWISDEVKNVAVILYVSMHGSTRVIAEKLGDLLVERGVDVEMFNAAVADVGEFAMSLVDAATLIIASPTVLTGLHPALVEFVFLAAALRPKVKNLAVVTSYGWGTRLPQQVQELFKGTNVEFLAPVLVKGFPGEDDLKKLEELADVVAKKHAVMEKIV